MKRLLTALFIFLCVGAVAQDRVTTVFKGLSDLAKLKTMTAGMHVSIDSGYLSGNYIIRDTTGLIPNGGLLLKIPGVSKFLLERRIDQTTELRPEFFEASGDNFHDDWNAIQNAIIVAYKRGGGVVKLMSGRRYKATKTIKLYKGVSIRGDFGATDVNDQIASQTDTSVYAVGAAVIVSYANGDAIQSDNNFANDSTVYVTQLENFVVDCRYQTSGVGIHFMKPKPTAGVSANGYIFPGLYMRYVAVWNSYSHGLWIEKNNNGPYVVHCMFYNSGQRSGYGNGAYIGSQDCHLQDCKSWRNKGAGYWDYSQTLRSINCDAWQNQPVDSTVYAGDIKKFSGYGFVLEGYNTSIIKGEADGNYGGGIAIIGGSTYTAPNRNIELQNCLVFGNSQIDDSQYPDIYIGHVTGSKAIGTNVIGSHFSYTDKKEKDSTEHNLPGTGFGVTYSVFCDTIPLYLNMTNVILGAGGLGDTSTNVVNDYVLMYANLRDCKKGSFPIENIPIPLQGNISSPNISNGGSIFFTQNTSATTLSNFIGAQFAASIKLIIGDTLTTIALTSNIKSGYTTNNYKASKNEIINFIRYLNGVDTIWYCDAGYKKDSSFFIRANNSLSPKNSDTIVAKRFFSDHNSIFNRYLLRRDTLITSNYTVSNFDYYIEADASSVVDTLKINLPTPFRESRNGTTYSSEIIVKRVDTLSTKIVLVKTGNAVQTIDKSLSPQILYANDEIRYWGQSSTNWNSNKIINISSLSTAATNLLKGNGTTVVAATPGTDYITPAGTETLSNKTINGSNNTVSNVGLTSLTTAATNLLKGNGTTVVAATPGTDYITPAGTETLTNKTINGSNNTVSNVGLSSLSTATTTLLKGDGATVVAATPGVDYLAPESYQSLTYSSSITVDYTAGTKYYTTLTGDMTIDFSNFPDGGVMKIIFKQDATGNHIVTFPANTKAVVGTFATGTSNVNLSTAGNDEDDIEITKQGSNYRIYMAKTMKLPELP